MLTGFTDTSGFVPIARSVAPSDERINASKHVGPTKRDSKLVCFWKASDDVQI